MTMEFPLRLASPRHGHDTGVLPFVVALNRRLATAWNQFVHRPCRATEAFLLRCDAQARRYLARQPLLDPEPEVPPKIFTSHSFDVMLGKLQRTALQASVRAQVALATQDQELGRIVQEARVKAAARTAEARKQRTEERRRNDEFKAEVRAMLRRAGQ